MPGPAPRLAPAPPVLNIALLDRLRAAGGGFVALEELAGGHAAGDLERVRTDLDALAAFGFAIERHPYRGAAYAGPADRLCPDQIEHELRTRRVGRRIVVWSRVSSTNDLAAEAAGSPGADGLVVLAEEQTAGRGRLGRAWTAPPRSCILMSVLLGPESDPRSRLHPDLDPDGLEGRGWLTALAAVATAEVVSDLVGRRADIKWPNDVRVDGRKIAGILVERPAVPELDPPSPGPLPKRRARTRPAVVGIGLNVNVVRDDLPAELRDRATSIQIETGLPADRSEVVRALICRLDHWYDALQASGAGAAALNAAWRDRLEGLGRLVRILTPDGPRTGRFVDLDLRRGLALVLTDGPDGANSPHLRVPLVDILAVEAAGPT